MSNELKKLIKLIVNEELSVDSPAGGPLGKVAFGTSRTDKVEPELNSDVEDEIFDAIYTHIDDNQSQKLTNVFDTVYNIAQTKKYKILTPNPGYVYRIIFGVSLENASSILGLSIDELQKANKATYTTTNGTLESSKEKKAGIQSWTSNPMPDVLNRFGTVGGGTLSHETPIIILARALVPSSGKFILNPEFTEKIRGLKYFTDEAEVVSKGPVNLVDASYINFVPDVSQKVFTEDDNEKFHDYFLVLKNKLQNANEIFKALTLKFIELLNNKTHLDVNGYSTGAMIKYNAKNNSLDMNLKDITYADLFENGVVETITNVNLMKDLLEALKNGK